MNASESNTMRDIHFATTRLGTELVAEILLEVALGANELDVGTIPGQPLALEPLRRR
jgi:hypothetical protein